MRIYTESTKCARSLYEALIDLFYIFLSGSCPLTSNHIIRLLDSKKKNHWTLHYFSKFIIFIFFKKQENILFSPRNNKYTIFIYEQNAQFTKVAT